MVKATFVCTLPAGTVAGVNEHSDLAGRPEQASVTAPPTPGWGVNVICCATFPPARTDTAGRVAARVNPGFVTVTLAVACAVAPYASTTVRVTLVTPTA